jgi:hypothetical protein
MEQDRRDGGDFNHKLVTSASPDHETGRGTGINPIFNMDNGDTNGLVSEPSVLGDSRRNPTANLSMRNVDGEGSVPTLSLGNHGHLHVATPTPYSGKKEDFHGFRRELGLYLTANCKDFQNNESMVIFALSYMKIGPAARWADMFMDKALEEDDWGSYADFLDQLTWDFSDKEEPRKALEEMGRLYQGKGTASDYFQKMEQLASIAGIDIDGTLHVLLQMENVTNSVTETTLAKDTDHRTKLN